MGTRSNDYQKARAMFGQANEMLAGKKLDDGAAFVEAWKSGEQTIRTYHDEEHFFDVAGRDGVKDVMSAVRFRAGVNHDVVYQHVDAKGDNQTGFSDGVEKKIAKFISRKGDSIYLSASPELKEDRLFQAALTLFDFNESDRMSKDGIKLDPYDRQNELLSALYAIEQGRALGIPDKYILAEVAHIQGTVPFGPAEHFEAMQEKLDKMMDAKGNPILSP
ncbi:MAG: hypothetical protein K2Q01_00510, partial [Rickettsiales bacterium]|nr:hypothetical protein [Rickettsiales bacterium]